MGRVKTARAARLLRHQRLRRRLSGNSSRPRLCVFRSLSHTYAQVIDDEAGHTLAAASSREPGMASGSKREVARHVGAAIAERSRAVGVFEVVFDRAGYRYHGRVQALAEGAREGGLKF